MKSTSYDTGKKNEKQSWSVLEKFGYIRPTSQQRKNIAEVFLRKGKEIKSKGFDLVKLPDKNALNGVDELFEIIENLTLFELKTAGKNRKAAIKENWSGLGFTLTGAEKYNAELLGEHFKFLFLNLKNDEYHVCRLEDFFSPEISGIYPTWSVFIKKGLTNQK